MACAFRYRVFAVFMAIIGLGVFSLGMQSVQAANASWTGSTAGTWDLTSNNWSAPYSGGLNQPSDTNYWDSTNGPYLQANFTTSGVTADATGNNLYTFILDFQGNTHGNSVTGGTVNISQGTFGVYDTASAGTDTVSSAIVLTGTVNQLNTTSNNTGVCLNLTGPITASGGTLLANPGGPGNNVGGGSVVALSYSNNSFNVLQQGNGSHGTILIPSGGSVTCNIYTSNNYAALVTNGTLACQNASPAASNGSAVNIIGGSGLISVVNWLSDGGGTLALGTAAYPFTGSLTVSGSFDVGSPAFPGVLPGNKNAGGKLYQTGGTVQLTGGIDQVTIGFNGTSSYNLQGGLLSIPNGPLELGFGNAGGFSSSYSQTGGSANIYGLWLGATQNLGAQPGNCYVGVTGGTLNLGAGGIAVGGGGTYGATFGNGTLIGATPLTLPSSVPVTLVNGGNTIFNTSGGNISLAGVISGSGGLTATGGGTLLFTAINTYTGPTTVSSGTLQLGDGTANVGSLTSNISAASGAVVLYAVPSSNTATYGNAMSGSGSLVVAGSGVLQITGTNNSFSGGTTISAGTLQLGDTYNNNGSLPSPITNNAALVFANPHPQTFAAAIGGSGSVFVNGPDPLALSGNNTFSGGVTLEPTGYLNVNSNTALGTGTLTITGGTIDSTAAGVALGNVPQNWNADFTFGGANNLNLGTGAVLISNSSRTITLNGGVLTVNGPISDGGAGFSLSTAGTGTLALGGTSTYSGGTYVNSGALAVNGALTGSGGVTVQSGGTLAGNGLVSGGGVTLNSGATLSPGPSPLPGSVGTFTASSLSVASGATFDFDLSNSTAAGNDLANVTGTLTLPPDTATIAVHATGGRLALNVPYTLFDYGSLTGTGTLAYSGPLGGRQTATFDYGTSSSSAITLTIAGNFRNVVWTGTGTNSDTWDQNKTGNLCWTSPQTYPSGDYFASLDSVTFDATSAPGNQTVSLDYNSGSPLTPSSVLVTGTKSYTFTGAGQIGGATALTIAGPGSLTIQNAGNSYTGGSNIQGGSVILGVSNGLSPNGTVTFGAATTSGTLDLAGNNQAVGGLAVAAGATPSQQVITNSTGSATLTYAATGSSTFGGAITGGSLALEVSGGQLLLSGNSNTYAGGTTVNGGTLQLGVANALPTAGNITALSGVLDLGGNGQTTSGVVSFQGATVQNGTLTSSVADLNAQSGTISASLAGPVALNKSTGGTLLLSSTGNTYTGGTNISGGFLQLGAANALPTGGNITVYSGATFDLGGVSQSTSGVVSFQGGTVQNGTLTSTNAAFDGQSGMVTANLTGSAGLNKSTTGTLVLGGTDSYTGNTVVSNGLLQLGSAAGIPGGATAGTVILNGGAATAGTINVNGFSPDFGGLSGAAGAVPGLITNFGGNGGTLTVDDNNSTSTFSGTLADGNSPLGFTKAGTGTLTLAGSNAYSGDTTVAQGILVLTSTAAIGNPTPSTNLTVNAGGELQLPAGGVINAGNVSVGGSGVTGSGAVNTGTLNVLGANVTMNGSSGTGVISSPTVLSASAGTTTLNCANANQTLLFSSPLTSLGSVTTSGSGNFVFSGSVAGTLQEGNGIPSRTATISVLPGTTLNVGTYSVPYYSNLTVGGTMNAGAIYTANGTTGQTFLNGSGVINAATFVGSGGGTVRFSNGVLNITGSAAIGPAVPALGAAEACTLEQDSGTVNVTGTGDGFTLGFTDASHGNGAYTQYGGVLNVPNEYVELCYESGAGGHSYFQVLGNATTPATANVYGISLGQTVNNGVQDGNGTVKLGDGRSLLQIGAGGIIAAGAGTQIFDLASGTLASSAPWSTTVPLTLNGAGDAPTNIDASAGTISLDGPVGGAAGIREIGSGVLVLGGTNTYTGGTYVEGSSTLIVNNSDAIDGNNLGNNNLYVGNDLGAFGTVVSAEVGHASAAAATSPVPEPGTLAVLAAGTALVSLLRRRRRTSRIGS